MASNGSSTPGSCADWEGNNSTLGFGGDLASEAAAINATEGQLGPITSFPSGGILPSLRFSVLDHFGNLVAGGLSPVCYLHMCLLAVNWYLRAFLFNFVSVDPCIAPCTHVYAWFWSPNVLGFPSFIFVGVAPCVALC